MCKIFHEDIEHTSKMYCDGFILFNLLAHTFGASINHLHILGEVGSDQKRTCCSSDVTIKFPQEEGAQIFDLIEHKYFMQGSLILFSHRAQH